MSGKPERLSLETLSHCSLTWTLPPISKKSAISGKFCSYFSRCQGKGIKLVDLCLLLLGKKIDSPVSMLPIVLRILNSHLWDSHTVMFEQLDPGKDEQRQLMSMKQILQRKGLKAQETFIYIEFHLGFSDQSWLWVPETVERKAWATIWNSLMVLPEQNPYKSQSLTPLETDKRRSTQWILIIH